MESSKRSPGMIEMCRVVIKKEGIGGFYQGVKGVMLGQAVIKSVAFSANAFALNQMLLQAQVLTPTLLHLCVAGSFSGLVTSFFVNPIERIKVLMQADRTGLYKSEVQCLQQIIKDDGVLGLLSRGLDATILREVTFCVDRLLVITFFDLSAVKGSELRNLLRSIYSTDSIRWKYYRGIFPPYMRGICRYGLLDTSVSVRCYKNVTLYFMNKRHIHFIDIRFTLPPFP